MGVTKTLQNGPLSPLFSGFNEAVSAKASTTRRYPVGSPASYLKCAGVLDAEPPRGRAHQRATLQILK
jgi:hypothetical protein